MMDASFEQRNIKHLPLKRTAFNPVRSSHKESSLEKVQDIWLWTLSDLLLLLTIFFVTLFGLTLQGRQQSSPVTPARGASPSVYERVTTKEEAVVNPQTVPRAVLLSFERDLRALLGSAGRSEEVALTRNADHLVLSFPEKILFEPAHIEIKPEARPILNHIVSLASTHPEVLVEVQGHTDDKPINTQRYSSNWELSVDRATQVARVLINLGLDPARITVKGFGQYRPLYANDSEEHRRKNRRVEVQFFLTSQT